MHTLDELVVESPAFAGLTEEQIDVIASCGTNVTIPAGDRLFREGDTAETFFLIRDGIVSLDAYAPGRPEVVVETLGAGEIVGWSWLVAPHTWQFTGRAVENVRAIQFDGRALRHKCEEDPVFGHDLLERFMHVLVDRLQATRVQLMDIYGNRGS